MGLSGWVSSEGRGRRTRLGKRSFARGVLEVDKGIKSRR